MPAEDDNFTIQDYQIHLPPLGEGTFGKVYRATYRGISERALKIFRPGAVDLSTMSRELEKLSMVAEHNGIVTLHDFNLLNEPPYYAMGLHADQNADGDWETRTLERLCGHVDQREAWRLIREISEALAYLHRNQIIHCDIKPSNILLTDDTPFHVKICDFGQSRGLAGEGFEPAGTPLYASPEQLRNPKESAEGKGFRWDVYSFGVVAYKLLTGELPRLQNFAEAERASYDLEATISEATLEETLAESGNAPDSEQLATLAEAVEEIEWPEDFYIPSSRKELIESCLSLDPMKRPADMRAVRNLLLDLDQQNVMKRARRLNSIFATLLVVAIWASGFAFIQAKRARDTNVELQRQNEHARNLALPFVTELMDGDITVDRIHGIIGDNAEAFLSSLPKDDQKTEQALRLSAQSASIRGRQAMNRDDFPEALEKYMSAYEIRSELAKNTEDKNDLEFLASRDLVEIGKIYEELYDLPKSEEAYTLALQIREDLDKKNERTPSLQMLRERRPVYAAVARVQAAQGEAEEAIQTIETISKLYSENSEAIAGNPGMGFQLDQVNFLTELGRLNFASGNLADSASHFQQARELAAGLQESESPTTRESALSLEMEALHMLGRINVTEKEMEIALNLFKDEIKLREATSRSRPFDAELRLSTADAYAMASRCLPSTDRTSRELATYYVDQALGLISGLPPKIRNAETTQQKIVDYNDYRSQLLELDE